MRIISQTSFAKHNYVSKCHCSTKSIKVSKSRNYCMMSNSFITELYFVYDVMFQTKMPLAGLSEQNIEK